MKFIVFCKLVANLANGHPNNIADVAATIAHSEMVDDPADFGDLVCTFLDREIPFGGSDDLRSVRRLHGAWVDCREIFARLRVL